MYVICLPMVFWVFILWMNVFCFLYPANVEGARDYNQPKTAWETWEDQNWKCVIVKLIRRYVLDSILV